FELGVSIEDFAANLNSFCNADTSRASYAKKVDDAFTVLCADKNVQYAVARDQVLSGDFCQDLDAGNPSLSFAILRTDGNYTLKCSNGSFKLNMTLDQAMDSTLCYEPKAPEENGVCA